MKMGFVHCAFIFFDYILSVCYTCHIGSILDAFPNLNDVYNLSKWITSKNTLELVLLLIIVFILIII